MTYKPNRRSTFDPNPAGVASLAIFNDDQVGVMFNEKQKKKFEDFAGKRFKVARPEELDVEALVGKHWFIRLNNDKNGIFGISPLTGQFKGKCKEFIAKDGEYPVPQTDSYEYEGRTTTYMYFTVLVEIVEGAEKGMTLSYRLRYNFGEDLDGNVEYTFWGKNSKHSPKLDTFLTAAGAWKDGPIPFKENILPILEKRIAQADQVFEFDVKDGYINDVWESLGTPEVWEDDDPVWNDEADDTSEKSDDTSEKSNDDFEWDN